MEKDLKKIGEGIVSNAFIDNKDVVLLVGKRNNSYSIYKNLKTNIDSLDGKIKSIKIPNRPQIIEPCNKYPFGALNYLAVQGKEIDLNICTTEQKIAVGKKLAEFLWEMHNTGIHWNKDFSIEHEKAKVIKNLKLLEPYFTEKENLYLQKKSNQYYNFLRESDYVVTHGDLHEENLLVNDSNDLVGIIDFGNMAYTPIEFDFAPIYKMDIKIFESLQQNYPKPIDISKVKMVSYFRDITFFEYMQDWSKEVILREVQDIRNSIIFGEI